jgi:hypothetical protein
VGGADPALQEQRLLSQVLLVLSRFPVIPSSFLRGKLIGQEPLPPMLTAQGDGVKEPAEFWAAIGNVLRPSITVTATIGLQLEAVPVDAPAVVTKEIRLGERASGEPPSLDPATVIRMFDIAGHITRTGAGPAGGARVSLPALGISTVTAADGSYALGPIAAGSYQLEVQAGTVTRSASIVVPRTAASHYNMEL